MKTQIKKPVPGKAKYSVEYKQQALELWRKSSRSAAKMAAELEIRPELLYKRSTDARQTQELEGENGRLREENAKLLEQREVLKKSLGILSEPPPRSMPGSNR